MPLDAVKIIQKDDTFLEDIRTPFEYSRINKFRAPLEIGSIDLSKITTKEPFTHNYSFKSISDPRINDLPPPLLEFMNHCLSVFRELNLNMEVAPLLSFSNLPIKKGYKHREDSGFHNDHGSGLNPSIIFLCVSNNPTEFLTKPPSLNWPEKEFTSIHEMAELYGKLNATYNRDNIVTIKPNHLYITNSYHIHRGVRALKDEEERIFVRLILRSFWRKSMPRFNTKKLKEELSLRIDNLP